MLMERVLAAAQPYLAGLTLDELAVGPSLIGCRLSNGAVGVSYLLRDALPGGCGAFPYAQTAEGQSAADIASWAASGQDDLQRGVGMAVLNAASQALDIDDDIKDPPFGLAVRPGEVVGMVGYIPPIAHKLAQKAEEMIIFDHGAWLEGDPDVRPTDQQPLLLPRCDILVLTGTCAINGTIDSLLAMGEKAREIVLVGTSTPMFPQGFKGSGVTRLAGSWWNNGDKDYIFKQITLAGGIRSISRSMQAKLALVE